VATVHKTNLIRLNESDLGVEHPDEDVRGRKVIDRAGNEVGKVDDLVVDDRDAKAHFLRIGSGGLAGIGTKFWLVPVEAVAKVTHDAVYIDQTREHMSGGPAYDPELVNDQAYLGGVYEHYNQKPHWDEGYVVPLFPWYNMNR